ncbi:MAG TPA: prepilin-type N-terminal cleavage/methylation domain-containing protein [Candidatus Paceibacterota bacterium]|nr:prepilin-type N-terminal cleavage/methylation domain-containing protein [Candidatus Paceibacterota bacterium]
MRGFTLIETVIYIALLSALMAGALTACADLIESAGTSNAHATIQDEGSFASRKLQWALTGLTAAPAISGSSCAQTLSLSKTGAQNNPIVFQYDSAGKSIEMKEGASGPYAITTSNVSVSCLSFSSIPAAGSGPSGVSASFVMNGTTFAVTAYLRQ